MIMRFTAVFSGLLLSTSVLFAQAQAPQQLRSWVDRAVDDCPGSKVVIEKPAPLAINGWTTWRATQTSTENRCGGASYVLTNGKAIFFGDAFELTGASSAEQKLKEFAKARLKKDVVVEIGKAAAPALRPVKLTAKTAEGPLSYAGWTDQGGRYFLVGRMGASDVDPGRSLAQALNASAGAKRGNTMARVQIIELSDFQCPTCARAHQILEPLITKNLDRISYTRLDLPLFQGHDWVMNAALAARAVQQVHPDKYWEFVDQIFASQDGINKGNVDSVLASIARDLNLDWKKVSAIASKPESRNALLAQAGRAFDSGIYGTPTFIINGRVVFYGNDADYVRSRIESLLQQK